MSKLEVAALDPLVHAFEQARIDPRAFGHREHLRVAWCYLRALPLEEALPRFVAHLRRLTVVLGVPEKFHATMSWAYVVALHDAMADAPGLSFDELLRARPDLANHEDGVLARHYRPEELASDRARRRFVLPRPRDRVS